MKLKGKISLGGLTLPAFGDMVLRHVQDALKLLA